MTVEEIIKYCLAFPDVYKDYPFDDKWTVMRHKGNQKSFALIFHYNGHPSVNLKCEPSRADFLRSIYNEVKPGFHMNKEHWNTVLLDGDLSDEEVFDMVQHSFQLTRPKKYKQEKS